MALAGLVVVSVSAQAQTIVWGTGQNMVGDTDVLNNGTYYDAVDFYTGQYAPGGVATVNGVAFNYLAGTTSHTDGKITVTNNDSTGDYTAAFSTTSPSSATYSNLVNTGAYGENTGGTVTLKGLTAGDTYQIQAWSYYTNDGVSSTVVLSGSTQVTLNDHIGQYAVGTFTADSTGTESFTFTGVGGHDFINTIAVFDETPEPSTVALFAVAITGLGIQLGRKRRLA